MSAVVGGGAVALPLLFDAAVDSAPKALPVMVVWLRRFRTERTSCANCSPSGGECHAGAVGGLEEFGADCLFSVTC